MSTQYCVLCFTRKQLIGDRDQLILSAQASQWATLHACLERGPAVILHLLCEDHKAFAHSRLRDLGQEIPTADPKAVEDAMRMVRP